MQLSELIKYLQAIELQYGDVVVMERGPRVYLNDREYEREPEIDFIYKGQADGITTEDVGVFL